MVPNQIRIIPRATEIEQSQAAISIPLHSRFADIQETKSLPCQSDSYHHLWYHYFEAFSLLNP